ncbi:MAG: S8 family serine peptidase [Geminicoccaceae bacterium]|nr:S8 family serine peptidase [Geminicoccaceae bacterium]
MARSRLSRRVEKILDEGQGALRNVIVQRRIQDSETVAALSRIGEVLTRRLFVSDKSQMLPNGGNESASLSANGPDRSLLGHLRDRLEQHRHATSGVLDRVAAKARGETRKLWIADSIVAELDKDDVAALAGADGGEIDIFENAKVSLPAFNASGLPMQASDERGSAYGLQLTNALAAWGAYGARGGGVRVAVLDTGVDGTHPDLAGKIDAFQEFDGNGNPTGSTTPHDSDRHGTHVAGTVLGGNAGGSWIGMAPEARLLAGLVLPGGSGTVAQILGGMQWAVDNNADVINMSLGGLTLEPDVRSPYNQAIITALMAGIPVVCAIGNDGHVVSGPPGNDPFAFSAGATDSDDRVAGFSGGRTHRFIDDDGAPPTFDPFVYMKPDVSAPGVDVLSSVPGGDWQRFSGTSMATPHVAGAIALILSATTIRESQSGTDRAFLLQDLLAGTSRDFGETRTDQRYGAGRIDVLAAIAEAHRQGFASQPVA